VVVGLPGMKIRLLGDERRGFVPLATLDALR